MPMNKVFLLVNFLILTPFVLVFALALYAYNGYHMTHKLSQNQQLIAVASAAEQEPIPIHDVLGASVENDQRVVNLRQFLLSYKSTLEPFAENIVQAADQHDIDYRLLPAIAMQESNLCKKSPTDSYNCWGFGVYGKNVRRFTSFAEAIDIVSATLAKEYKNKGFVTPEEIVEKYTPSDNGKWVNSVMHFMDEIKNQNPQN